MGQLQLGRPFKADTNDILTLLHKFQYLRPFIFVQSLDVFQEEYKFIVLRLCAAAHWSCFV